MLSKLQWVVDNLNMFLCFLDEAMFTSSFDDVIFSLSGSKSRRVKRSRFAKAKDLQSTTVSDRDGYFSCGWLSD